MKPNLKTSLYVTRSTFLRFSRLVTGKFRSPSAPLSSVWTAPEKRAQLHPKPVNLQLIGRASLYHPPTISRTPSANKPERLRQLFSVSSKTCIGADPGSADRLRFMGKRSRPADTPNEHLVALPENEERL